MARQPVQPGQSLPRERFDIIYVQLPGLNGDRLAQGFEKRRQVESEDMGDRELADVERIADFETRGLVPLPRL